MRPAKWYIFLILILLWITPSIADAETAEQRIEKLEKQAENQGQLMDGYQKLLEESKNFREHLQQQFQQSLSDIQTKSDSMNQTFNTAIALLSVLIIAVQFFLAIVIGVSRTEVRQTIKRMKRKAEVKLQEQQQKIQSDYEEKSKQMIQKSEKKLRDAINENYDELLQRLIHEDKNREAIQQIVQNELSYVSARICFISHSEDEMERIKKKEAQLLTDFGIKEEILSYVFFQKQEVIMDMLKNGEIDVLIYSCEKIEDGQIDNTFIDLVEMLEQLGCQVPLLIYTYQRESSLKGELTKLKGYFNYAIANFPATLLGNLISLAYMFNRNTKQSKIIPSENRE